MSSHSYREELPQPFALTVKHVRAIVDVLEQRVGTVSIKATCVDNTTRKFESVEELDSFQHPSTQQIEELEVSALSKELGLEPRAAITFSSRSWREGVTLSVDANQDTETIVRNELKAIVAGTEPWYGWACDFSLLGCVLFVHFLGLCVATVWAHFMIATRRINLNTEAADEANQSRVRLYATVCLAVFIALVYGVYQIYRLIDYTFPFGSFLIGQGSDRFCTRENWRWGFVIATAASLCASIIIIIKTQIWRRVVTLAKSLWSISRQVPQSTP